MSDLNARLLKAHAARDGEALAHLYMEAGETAEDEAATGFYLTQAYVFALESDLPISDRLRQMLVELGREAP